MIERRHCPRHCLRPGMENVQIERETEHEILDIKIEDIKRSRQAKEEEIVQA